MAERTRSFEVPFQKPTTGRRRAAIVASTLACLAGCGDAETPPASGVTWTEDIQPLMANHCVACHSDGSFAPFSLTEYETARDYASSIASAVTERRMPPHPADNSGACNTFRDANWLSDEAIASIVSWAEDGAPKGPDRAPVAPPERGALSGDLVRVDLGADYLPVPNEGGDDYRCFLIDAPVEEGDYFLRGYQPLPGNAAIVHHLIFYIPLSDEDVSIFEGYDAADPEPGYQCFGGPGGEVGDGFSSLGGAWAPGGGAIQFPANTGLQLVGGRKLVVQMHYNTLHGEGTDRTAIDMAIGRDGVQPIIFLPFGPTDFELSPNSAEELVELEGGLLSSSPPGMGGGGMGGTIPSGFELIGMFPHMHGLGTSIQLERADGSCLIDVPEWDYHWQLTYFLDSSQTLGLTDELRVRCGFDTRGVNQSVTWGEGSLDEMCAVGLLLRPIEEP
jgi:hypothetical protein